MKQQFLYIILVLLLFAFLAMPATAQEKEKKKNAPSQSNTSLQKAASKLSETLSEKAPGDEEVAADYVHLAKELSNKKEYAKAEEYWKKALQLYKKLKQKDKESEVERELAKLQEAQGNVGKATELYETASNKSLDVVFKEINRNDAERLKNAANPMTQSNFIEKNIELLEKSEAAPSDEKAAVYTQMADANVQLNQNEVALKNYQEALKNVPEKAPEALDIQRKMADVYIADRQPEKGISTLTEVYQLALAEGNTIEAKRSLVKLAAEYHKSGNNKQAMALYQDFLGNLEHLIRTDSSLVNAQLFQSTEEKIVQLEKEKSLKDALITKKNTLNNVLIVSIVLMVVFLALLAKAFYTIKIRNKKIALQSLRREMNPHFIFNSLNSVNQFIAQSDEVAANKYLASYSRLMRNTMENSNKDFIRLDRELEQLREYLELEHLRFADKFSYEISIGKNIDTEHLYIPGMLLQPYLENAIWHGLRYKESKGMLLLSVQLAGNELLIKIEDDGIGLTKSKELKTQNQKIHQSRGLNNVNERVKLLNELYRTQIGVKVFEKESLATGVVVEIRLPLIDRV